MPERMTGDRPELKPVNVGAAAIDIGSKMHLAAVNPPSANTPVRSFGTCTEDLHDRELNYHQQSCLNYVGAARSCPAT
jgi:transposase